MGLQGRTSKPIAVVSRSVVSRSRDIWYRTGIGLAPAAGLFCLEGQCSTHQRDRIKAMGLQGRTSKPIAVVSRSVVS